MRTETEGDGRADGDRPFVVFVGAITPAEMLYAPLLAVVGGEVRARLKDLEVFSEEGAPSGYSLDTEVEGIKRLADEAGEESVHLVGVSAGAVSSLVFAAKYPERAASLALVEPPRTTSEGWTSEDEAWWKEADEMMSLSPMERMGRFPRLTLGAGVEPPPRPDGPPPPWMMVRAVGMADLHRGLRTLDLDPDLLRAFRNPVYLALGTSSHPAFFREVERMKRALPNLEVEVYEGLHHLAVAQTSEPDRFARALRRTWARAERPMNYVERERGA
ncbi:MAG: alpha/beta fold hydrolase [Rubrobacteraceae bacterium]